MIKYKIYTDKGNRDVNEDSVGVGRRDQDYCFVLADGLGGHGSGDIASGLVVKTITDHFQAEGSVSSVWIKEAIELAQEKLMEAQDRLHKNEEMKTTVVVLAMNEEHAIWAHIGDSRLYHFKKRDYVRTMDHSVPQMLVTMGEISEKQIRNHPDRNRLIKVMGVEWDSPKYEVAALTDVHEKEAFLLSSDGFWELINEKEMQKSLKHSENPDDWVERMSALVNKNGAGTDMDNNSAIVVMITPVKKR